MNLKEILMKLGNKLVCERQFVPAVGRYERKDSTWPIVEFTAWINETPDAQEVLAEMGIAWPVVKK